MKNLPAELHAQVAARARSERVSMSEWVTRTLRKELERPSVGAWIEELRDRQEPVRDIDSARVVRAVREDTDPDDRFDNG